MCYHKRAQSTSDAPYRPPVIPEEPRTEIQQEFWRRLTCVRILAYYDQQEGHAFCVDCVKKEPQIVKSFSNLKVIQSHMLYNNYLKFHGCQNCDNLLVTLQPCLSCPECVHLFYIYRQTQISQGINGNDLPNFILNQGPSPIPHKLIGPSVPFL